MSEYVNLLMQIPLAGLVVVVVIIFLRYMAKKDSAVVERELKRDEQLQVALIKLADAIDDNSKVTHEVLTRVRIGEGNA